MEKNKKVTIITIILIVVLAIVLGILIWFIQKWDKEKQFNTPEEVAKVYFEYINTGNYEKAYDLLTDESKNKINMDDFKNTYTNFYNNIECVAIKTEQVNCNKIDDTNSKIAYTNNIRSLYGDFKFDNTLNLIKQKDKKYYIDWNMDSVYPNFNSSDKIKVNSDEAKRGSLIDRNGVLLAGSGYIASIGIVPGWMNQDTKEQDIKRVSELLGISVENINKKLGASYVKEDTFVELDTVSKQDSGLLAELREIEGIKIKDVESRVYPLGEKAAHITGYVQKASKEDIESNKLLDEKSLVGKTGLEKAYDDKLKGKNGYEVILTDENGNEKNVIFKSIKEEGENIKLTIDANLQSKVYDIYKGDNSATVIMYPGTGEILALVSTPSYDPNKFVIGMSSQEWNNLNNDANNPLYPRFLKRYAPGSTFKPIIGAIALETGTINAYDEYEASGLSWQKDSSWGAYTITTLKAYNEPANLENALIYSDNIFFAKTALKIGADKLGEELKKLGFEEEMEFDLDIKNSQISNNGKFSNDVQLADSGYGQGEILVNPIHFAVLYSVFANNGNMVKPYIEMKADTETTFIKEHVFSKNVTDVIKEDLIKTIENPEGTGHSAKIDGLTLAGKTGTAETKSTKIEDGKEIGWFNVFINDENSDKQYLIVSMVEGVENKGGSQYVINKVKQILK